jgi:hypothetical protein
VVIFIPPPRFFKEKTVQQPVDFIANPDTAEKRKIPCSCQK